MQLPRYSPLFLILIQAVCIIGIALVIRRLYRSAASSLLVAEPIGIPDVPSGRRVRHFAVTVRRDGKAPGSLDWLLIGGLHGLVRWLIYVSCGIAVLYFADSLFLPTPGRSARWVDYRFNIGVMFVLLLVVNRLRVRVASSGLWVFAFMVGFAWGVAFFGVVFVSIPAFMEQARQGVLHALLAILGGALLLGALCICLRLVYEMARGMLWFHRFLAEHSPASPAYVGMTFFWAWVCYFCLTPSSQLPVGEAAFQKLAQFMVVPLLLYAVTSLGLLRLVDALIPRRRPHGLLFLRSFTRVRESERLFRGLAIDWTEVGPLYVLNGPDIVRTTLDSKMLMAFLSDRVAAEFITNVEGVESRLSAIRKERGWDLRYRVEDLKCSGAIWRHAFQKLLGYCDVVLVDLRGFDERHTGTAFEVFTLIQAGEAHKALLLCDNETNLPAVERIGRAALAQRERNSADLTEGLSLVEASGGAGRVRRFTMQLLLSMADPR